MYCEQCGKQLANNAQFCDGCGSPTSNYYNKIGRQQYTAQAVPVQQPVVQQPKGPSMKFHGFVKILLWILAVLDTMDFVDLLYKGLISSKFAVNDFAKIETLICALVYALVAVLCVFSCFRIANFKKDGPKFLTFAFIGQVIICILNEVVYYSTKNFSINVAEELNDISINNLLLPVACTVFMILSIVYYKKRKDMFIN